MDELNPVTQEASDAFVQGMLGQTQEQQTEQMEQDLGVTPEAPASPAPVEPAPQQAPEQAAPAPQEESQEREAGKDGSVRDVAGAVQNALGSLNEPTFMTQATDAVAGFLGLGSQEERQQQREEGAAQMQENAQQAIEADPVGAAVADTLVRAVPGGALDAAEDVLSAAEVIGDTVKTFATLGTVDPSQNPFSDKYDWAQWKLGADEIGAKTPVGQFAQELVSFAAIGSRLGAFKSFGGAANAATKLGKVGQVAKAAGVEAFYGMATDAIKGLAGEGNFANMLEQIVPGLKDTWVTALAVDGDDNPWEAAVKSALDGAALGFPVGALGAVAAGTRAAKGKAGQEALDAFAEGYAKQIELDLPKTKVNNGFDYADALGKASRGEHDQIRWAGASDSQIESISNAYGLGAGENMPLPRAEGVQQKIPALELAENRVATKVPVYWDDVAATMPEMFTPGSRAVQPDFAPSVYEQLRKMEADGGGTFDPFTGEVPETGTMVAIDGKSLESLEPNDVQDFIADNYDILSREDVYLGAWVSEITGKPVVELSRRVEDFEVATQMGKAFDQEGIFRMDDFSYHNTGGIDKLKETKGFHQRSAYTQPNFVREPANPKQVARLQMTPEAPNGAIGGRLYTDSQIAKVASQQGEKAAQGLEELTSQIDIRAEDLADMMPVKDVYEKVSYDLDDFIDDGGHVDVSKLTKGVDGLLDQQGSLQTRILISNIAGTVFDEARVAASKTRQGIDDTASLEIMTDNLKVLLRLHKKVANTRSRQLSQFAMPLDKAEGAKVRKLQADADAADKGMEIAEKALNDMVAGIKSGDPKRIRQAKRTAAFMELSGGDPAKMARVAKGIPELYMDVALKHMYNSLLSSPATHVVNTASNFLQMTSRPIQAALGGQGAAAKASFYNMGEMLSESFDLAKRSFADGTTQGSKMVQSSETDLALKNLAEMADTPTKQLHSGILNMLNDVANWPVLGWPSKFLTTSDEFFKAMNSRMEYRVQTYLEAEQLAKVSPGSETDTIMRELMSDKARKSRNFGKKDGRVMNEQLLDVAKELTFQTDLEGWAGTFAKTVQDIPVLRPFFPFVKTGHNIMVYTGTHTPILNLALSESRKALRGELGPYAQAVHQGRMAMGGMFMMLGGIAAHNGVITGSGPKDKNRRTEWEKKHQARSLKVGEDDKGNPIWVSYDRIEPFGQILTAMADIHHAMQEGELEPNKAEYFTSYLMYSIASNITDKTFFQGVNDLAAIISPNGTAAGTKAISAGLNLVNNFIPVAGARRAISNALTPHMQEYHKVYDRTLRQMGLGAFTEAPADKIDHLSGDKLDSASAGFWNALMPLKVVKRGSDSVRDALEDIHFETAAVRQELGGIELKPAEESRLNELIAESGLHAAIKKIVENPHWKADVEKHREDMRAGTTNMPREGMEYYRLIKEAYTKHTTYALQLLQDENPELAKAVYDNNVLKKKAKQGYVEGLLNTTY